MAGRPDPRRPRGRRHRRARCGRRRRRARRPHRPGRRARARLARDRRHRPGRGARLRRPPHPLRRPAHAGTRRPARRRCTASPPCSAATAASPSPRPGEAHAAYLMRMMARVEGMPLEALEAGLPWDWTSYADWFDRLDGHDRRQRRVPRRPLGGAAGRDGRGVPRAGHARRRSPTMARARAGGVPGGRDGVLDVDGADAQRRRRRAGAVAGGVARTSWSPWPAAVRDVPGTTLEAILAGCINGFTDDERDLLAAMSAAAQRPLNWNVLGVSSMNPTGHESQLAAVRPRRRARRPGGGAHAPALDAAAAVVPVRLRARRVPRLARGALAARARADGGPVAIPTCGAASTPAPTPRRPGCSAASRAGAASR